MLRKCLGEASHVIPIGGIKIVGDFSFEKLLVAILDQQFRKLRTKDISLLKVLYLN